MDFVDVAALPADPAWCLGNLADLRPSCQYRAGHPAPAVSLPVTDAAAPGALAEALAEALAPYRLPPRHEPLVLIAADERTAAGAADYLLQRGRSRVSACVLAPGDLARLDPSLVAAGSGPGRLWKPPPLLVECLPLLPPPGAGPVLDLGSGSGRAAVWLAERGYEVTAVDRQPEALDMGRRLAAEAKVQCRWQVADLRHAGRMPPGPWALVLAFRFLDRPLLASLAQWLRPVGVVVVRTFRQTPDFAGPPAGRHLLQPGELLRLFRPEGWEILLYREDAEPDGRPAAGIVARLRQPGSAEPGEAGPASVAPV